MSFIEHAKQITELSTREDFPEIRVVKSDPLNGQDLAETDWSNVGRVTFVIHAAGAKYAASYFERVIFRHDAVPLEDAIRVVRERLPNVALRLKKTKAGGFGPGLPPPLEAEPQGDVEVDTLSEEELRREFGMKASGPPAAKVMDKLFGGAVVPYESPEWPLLSVRFERSGETLCPVIMWVFPFMSKVRKKRA